ncbi:MAG TPA: alpha/beta hydrolase [Dermatophilaceae bacterium]|nr:alpha/beta hydrolase [Dermatophilaceae bacterium]
METTEFSHVAPDGTELAAYRWSPEGAPRAVVVVIHGLAEHARRYARLGAALTGAGYVGYAHDNRGHGRTAARTGSRGTFGPGGWAAVVDDIGALVAHARSEHPDLLLVVLGHSLRPPEVADRPAL